MLGLGAHVGELLLVHQRYLSDSLVAETSKGMVDRELGMVLRWMTLLAHVNGLRLNSIACGNLIKVDERARSLNFPGIAELPDRDATLTLDAYAELAAETDQEITVGVDPHSLSVPMLGLAGEVGTLLAEEKKRYRRDSRIKDWPSFVGVELGDLLWYTAAVARHAGLGLAELAERDLKRAIRSSSLSADDGKESSTFDETFPATERVPRQLHLRFQERTVKGQAVVTMTLLAATPNAFPKGPIPRGEDKFQGFKVGEALGDQVTDNSRRVDAYRYHDAIHLGFLAVLGWSPNLRGLLHVKRKSDAAIDEAEDGARAIFAEEGIAAILAKQATLSRRFEAPNLVPEDLLDLIALVVEDLEVSSLPYRMWREAISQGFTVMKQLSDARGGYVLADLDARTLQYSKFPFAV
ncbi:nucleoside triphosphate pyrophosphohydrolase family protein [Intrasporangium mesophilum]